MVFIGSRHSLTFARIEARAGNLSTSRSTVATVDSALDSLFAESSLRRPPLLGIDSESLEQ